MVKGISRRVVVVDSPDQRFFEQAIFIVRNDAAGEGVTARELVEEARRVARNYAGGDHGRFSRIWRDLSPAVYTLMGAAGIGLVWLWIISEGLTQNSVHGLLPHIQTDGP